MKFKKFKKKAKKIAKNASKLSTWKIACLIFFFALIYRLIFFNQGFYHHDTARLAGLIEKTTEQGISEIFSDEFLNLRIGYVIINYLVFQFMNLFLKISPEITIHTVSSIFGALSCAMLFLFAEKYFSKKTAIFASIMLALLPVFVMSNTIGKEDGAEMFFFLLTLFLLLEKKILFSGISFGLYAAVKEAFLIYSPLILLFFILSLKRQKNNKKKLFNTLQFLVPFLIIFFMILNLGLMQRLIQGYHAPAEDKNFPKFYGYTFPRMVRIFNETMFSFPALLLPVALIGLFLLYDKAKHKVAFLLAWLSYYLFWSGLTVFYSRYLIFPIIPLILASAYGLDRLWEGKQLKFRIFAFGIVCYAVIFMTANSYPVLESRARYNGYKEIGLYMNENAQKGSQIIHFECSIIDYYTDQRDCSMVFERDHIMKKLEDDNQVFTTQHTLFTLDSSALENDWNSTIILEKVGRFYYEDWHTPLIELNLVLDTLYEIKTKS